MSEKSKYAIDLDLGADYEGNFDIDSVAGDYYAAVWYRAKGSDGGLTRLPYVVINGIDDYLDERKMITKEGADAEFLAIVAMYNVAIKKEFGESAIGIPEKGIERILWAMGNGAVNQINGEIVYTKPD